MLLLLKLRRNSANLKSFKKPLATLDWYLVQVSFINLYIQYFNKAMVTDLIVCYSLQCKTKLTHNFSRIFFSFVFEYIIILFCKKNSTRCLTKRKSFITFLGTLNRWKKEDKQSYQVPDNKEENSNKITCKTFF